MTEPENYQDPVLARRLRRWMKEATPTTAPERLVYAVMDEVERQPPRRPRILAGIGLQGAWQYVALTVVIAVGVAAGTLATRQDFSGTASPSPGPAASPSDQPPSPTAAAAPTLPTIERYNFARAPGPSAIGSTGSSLWVGTPDGSIVELDASTGDELRRLTVGVEPITITPVDGLLWVGSGGDDLAWVDPASGEVGSIAGAGGHYVLARGGSLWVSRLEEFLQVDLSSRAVVASLPVAGHRASDPGLIVGDELWTGSGARIVRIALASGAVQGTIPVLPSGLLASPDGILAIDRGTLLRISTPSGPLDRPISLTGGLPDPVGAALGGGRLWVIGAVPDRAGEIVEVDVASGWILSRTPVGGGPRAVAVVDGSVWVAVDTGALWRLAAAP